VLAELARIERELAKIPPGHELRGRAVTHLQSMVWKFGGGDSAGAAAAGDIGAASADDLFDLLDNDFGLA
jgi:hypothetical protein